MESMWRVYPRSSRLACLFFAVALLLTIFATSSKNYFFFRTTDNANEPLIESQGQFQRTGIEWERSRAQPKWLPTRLFHNKDEELPHKITTQSPVPTFDTGSAKRLLLKYESLKKDRWIVLTTIFAPTPQVRDLSQIPGWQLLVIGDIKTPEGWSLDNAIYLGPSEQVQLDYTFAKLLPFSHYSRKNVGYIFAIQHGAEFIYETDDDNVPFVPLETFNLSPNKSSQVIIETQDITYNPCLHFGQSTLWPRGYPLNRIAITNPREYKIMSVRAPPVQQGFVNGDPDLDAIFRMTRKHTSKPLDLYFDDAAPPVMLPEGTFAPMNSQNTMYHKSVFWGLLFPSTIPDRIADIYRAYWIQRLLWLTGEMVAFYPPNAYQERTAHSYIKDATLEMDMYRDTPRLLEFLRSWKCTLKTLPECIDSLTSEMAMLQFWGAKDVEVIHSWLEELQRVGYTFPPIAPAGVSLPQDFTPAVFYPDEKNTSLMYQAKKYLIEPLTNHEYVEQHLLGICEFGTQISYKEMLKSTLGFKGVVLVVGLTSMRNLPAFEAMHRAHFRNIIYCGASMDKSFFHKWNSTYIPVYKVPTAQKCLTRAVWLRQIVKGYLYVPDSTLIFSKSFRSEDFTDTPWISVGNAGISVPENRNTITCLQTSAKSQDGDLPLYLPKSKRRILAVFNKFSSNSDVGKTAGALSTFVACSTNVNTFRSSALTENMATSGIHYVHPFTYSSETLDRTAYVCTYLKQELGICQSRQLA